MADRFTAADRHILRLRPDSSLVCTVQAIVNITDVNLRYRCEKPCLSHKQYLVVRSHNPEGQPQHHPMERPDDMEYDHMSGHALMATCPPMSHIMDKPGEPYPHQMPDLSKSALMKLLEMSAQIDVEDGEITPVRAWWMIIHDERVYSWTKRDFDLLKVDLLNKVRCYG